MKLCRLISRSFGVAVPVGAELAAFMPVLRLGFSTPRRNELGVEYFAVGVAPDTFDAGQTCQDITGQAMPASCNHHARR